MNKIEIEIPEYNDEKSAENAIYALLSRSSEIETQCEVIADEYGIEFSTGDYGSGKTYYPAGYECSRWLAERIECNGGDICKNKENSAYTVISGAWVSSSEMC